MQAKWIRIVERRNIDFVTTYEVILSFYKYLDSISKYKNDYIIFLYKNNAFIHYTKLKPQVDYAQLYRKFFRNKNQILKLYKEGVYLLEEAKKEVTKIKKYDKNSLLSSLRINIKQNRLLNDKFSSVPFLAITAWEMDFEKIILKLIRKKKIQKKSEQIFYSVTKPWKETSLVALQREIASGIDKKKIQKKYSFLRSFSIILFKDLNREWFSSIECDVKKNMGILPIDAVIKMLNPSKKEEEMIRACPYITFFKDWRDDLRRKFVFLWRPFFDKIGAYFKIPSMDLGYLTLDEILAALKKGSLDYKKIKMRKSNISVITKKRKGMCVYTKNIPKEYIKIFKEVDSQEQKIMIKGIIAYKGKVQGKARIVRS